MKLNGSTLKKKTFKTHVSTTFEKHFLGDNSQPGSSVFSIFLYNYYPSILLVVSTNMSASKINFHARLPEVEPTLPPLPGRRGRNDFSPWIRFTNSEPGDARNLWDIKIK
jgi:hypothetical protein